MSAAHRNKYSREHPPPPLLWLRLKYRLACSLEAPFGDVFWFFHQWAVRLQDELANREAIQ